IEQLDKRLLLLLAVTRPFSDFRLARRGNRHRLWPAGHSQGLDGSQSGCRLHERSTRRVCRHPISPGLNLNTSETIFERQLDLALSDGCGRQTPEGPRAERPARDIELRRVERVEKLRPEHQLMSLTKGHFERLGRRQIKRLDSRREQWIAGRVAVLQRASRKG